MIGCPSCAAPMARQRLARRPQGELEVDTCHACHLLWFDPFESTALTPGAVVELFRQIHEHHETLPRPVAQKPRCPHCRAQLALTHDLQRTNRITYHRCPSGCGRLTTFFQFLREKEFVRSLTGPEVQRLRAQVAQVRCSSCGAPVDLKGDACAHCRAPISILDADAVAKTLAQLSRVEATPRKVDPAAAVEAALAGKRVQRRPARTEGRHSSAPSDSVELVGDALDFLVELLN